MQRLPDPRLSTVYACDVDEPELGKVFYLPVSTKEEWCMPGYQKKRPDKGYALTVNDYPFHPIEYGGKSWSQVVHTPFQTDNENIGSQ